ncbi:MAG TPA: HDOD domain-containing protein, partial [Opitutaceae bacterium]|nr:HDOD domain-containing protein [Opitutaceae bacterium]
MPVEPLSDTRLTAAAAKLPAAPRIFQQLSAAIKDPDVSVEALVTVVRLDPVLSARVIRASNSALFSRGGNIVSLDGAIERIGIYEVFQLVGAAMASQLYSGGLPVYGISGDQLWENSVTTAVALDHLAESAGEDGRVGYILGLLR